MNDFIELLEEKFRLIPEKDAVYTENGIFTYGDLAVYSSRVYSYLKRKGIKANDIVMLHVERTIDQIISCIGVLKAGAAFLFAAPNQNPESIRHMYEECSCKLLIDDTNIRQILNEKGIDGYEPANLHDLAYVQYTSGSMRNPKGAMLERGAMALCNEFLYFRGKNIATAQEFHRVALLSPLSFAAGILIMNATLANGMTLFDVPRDVVNSPVSCKEYFTEHKITTCFMTPSYYRLFNGFNPEMSIIVLGGERVRDIRLKAGDPAIYNIYSQSESGFVVAVHRVSGSETEVPVGLSGIRGITIRLLDDNGRPLGAGDTGEICYDNPYFRGYAGEKDNAVRDGIFHSGDIGKMLDNGELLVIGRKDDMVKVHGLWMNLQEIETVFQERYGTDWCFARCVTEKTKVNVCVYYTGKSDIHVQQAREELKELLPEHMLPTHVFHLEHIPTNRNGKLQIQKLPLPGKEALLLREKAFAVGLEHELSDIVKSVVDSPEEIGMNVNLISLGLSSLSAIMLIGLLEEKYHIRLTLAEIMDKPDIQHIATLIKEKEGNDEADVVVSANHHNPYLPLTKNQLGVLAECEANRNSVQYNIPAYISFPSSELSISRLKEAIMSVFKQHSFVNSRIISGREVPLKYRVPGVEVYQKISIEPPVIEILEQDNDFPDEASERNYFQGLVVPYNIFDERLYRVKLLRTPAKIYLFVDAHHIITDGFSLNIVADDISSFLAGKAIQPEKVTFPEYISMEHSFAEEDSEYLANLMEGVETFKYPYYSQETESRLHRIDEIKTFLPKGSISRYCQEKGFTESSYFHSALLLTLYILTGESPFIATAYNGRSENAGELMRTFGFFAKSVPVVWSGAEPADNIRTEDFIGSIQEQILSTCSHRNVIYSDLRVRSDVLMSFLGELGLVSIDRHEVIDLQLDTPQFPIQVQVKPNEEAYRILLLYDISCFKREDMQLLYDSLLHVLSCLKSAEYISDIPLVDGDIAQFLSRKRGEARQIEDASWLCEFYRQVRLRPEAEAVLAENGSFSYRELNEASDKIAHFLAEHGVKPNDFVAVKMPRVKEFSAVIVGIHKCGAAYIPIDPAYPEGRISYILEDSGAKLILTEAIARTILEQEHRTFDVKAGDIAYMIYTSGSTGLPKGVKISHRALMNYLKYVQEKVGVDQSSRLSCYASFAFDISVEGLFTPLIAGGTVCIVPSSVRKDVRALEEYLREAKVTGGCFPTQIGQLLGQDEAMDMDYITLIGEKMTAIPGNKGRVFNAYDPTEATVVVTYYGIDKGRAYSDIPIGWPMYNTSMLILDPFGNLLPDGATGELCIAGPQLSEGYHNNEEKTARAFTPLRQSPNVRIYHTGDMAKYLPDGNLMFLGRLDRQLKRSGFRIEPGEIENIALQYAKLKEAVVQSKNGKLILYYTLKDNQEQRVKEELIASLKEKLPSYMIPDGFMQLDSMPLTPNGKIDTKRLPEYHFEAGSYIPPRNERELELCNKFAKLLHVKKVGITDDFFELGGNSLDAVQLSVILGEGYELSDIYNGRTVSGIIKAAENRNRVGTQENRSIYPLTEEQKKFFFVEEMGARPEVSYANVPMLFQLPDDTDMLQLQSYLTRIVNNHPYLKVRFRENPDAVNGSEEWYVAVRDDSIPPEVNLYFQDKFDKKVLIRPYNLLGDENLYRIALYDIMNNGKYLFLDFHHVLYDGESLMIMIDELKTLMTGGELVPEMVTGYDVAVDEWERKEQQREQIVSFYHELLKDSDKKLNDWINDRRDVRQRLQRSKDFDESRGVAILMGSRIISVVKSRVDMTYIRRRCSELRITENMLFNAAFACMLGECNGKSEALYANVIKNRDYAALEHTVTMMCKTVPIYLKVTEDTISTPTFIKQLRKSIADAKKGSLLSYEDICNRNNIIVPRITMIFRERPADEEIMPGCREIGLDTLETIDSLMVKIYFDKGDNLYIKFDTSLDFTRPEIDMMSERLDELISRI